MYLLIIVEIIVVGYSKASVVILTIIFSLGSTVVLGEARALSTDDSIRTSLVSAEITIMKVYVLSMIMNLLHTISIFCLLFSAILGCRFIYSSS